jgi:hypothetical protein
MIKLLWCGGSVNPYARAGFVSDANFAFEILDFADAKGLAADLKASLFKGSIFLALRITRSS